MRIRRFHPFERELAHVDPAIGVQPARIHLGLQPRDQVLQADDLIEDGEARRFDARAHEALDLVGEIRRNELARAGVLEIPDLGSLA